MKGKEAFAGWLLGKISLPYKKEAQPEEDLATTFPLPLLLALAIIQRHSAWNRGNHLVTKRDDITLEGCKTEGLEKLQSLITLLNH